MENCDDRLRELQTLIAGKQHAEASLNNLLDQRRDLEKRVWELNYARMSEQEDVDRLEDQSFKGRLVNFLMRVQVDEDKEKDELEAAILKLDLAKRELKKLDFLVAEKQETINRIADAQAEYERLLQEKAETITGTAAQEINELRRRIADRESRRQNVTEAILAGQKVSMIVVQTRDALNAAIDSCDPRFARRGYTPERARLLNQAQEQFGEFTFRLRRFRSEMADVRKVDERSLQIGELDLFENRIRNLRERRNRVLEIDRTIREILIGLDPSRRLLEKEAEEAREKIKKIVMETKV